jgi:hypothetical protein
MSFSRELEWIFAAEWANYPVMSFFDLPGWQQSMVLAAYQIKNQFEAVQAYEQEKESRRATSKAKSGGGRRRR